MNKAKSDKILEFLKNNLSKAFNINKWVNLNSNDDDYFLFYRKDSNLLSGVLIFEIIKENENHKNINFKITKNDYEKIEKQTSAISNMQKNNCLFSTKIIIKESLINEIENNGLIELYLLSSEYLKKDKRFELFEKYGISIFTEIKKDYDKKEFSSLFYSIEIEKIESNDFFKTSDTYIELKSITDIPTSSSTGGIQNVRDIYLIENKKGQYLSIVKTLINTIKKSEIKQSEPDVFWFSKSGKEKDFAYIDNETEINKIQNSSKFLLRTTNGSLIDGQNSIDTLNHIYLLILELKEYNYHNTEEKDILLSLKKDSRKFKNKKAFDILLKYLTEEDLLLFFIKNLINFECLLEKTLIKINFSKEDDNKSATLIADSKNLSIAVNSHDLEVSQNILEAITISNFAYNTSLFTENSENLFIDIYYPKKNYYFYQKSIYSMNFNELSAAFNNYLSIKDEAKEYEDDDEYIKYFSGKYSDYRFLFKDKINENSIGKFFEYLIENKNEESKEELELNESKALCEKMMSIQNAKMNTDHLKLHLLEIKNQLSAIKEKEDLKSKMDNLKLINKEELFYILTLIKNTIKAKEEIKLKKEFSLNKIEEYVMSLILIKNLRKSSGNLLNLEDISVSKIFIEMDEFSSRLIEIKEEYSTDITGIFNKSKKKVKAKNTDDYLNELNQIDLIQYLMFGVEKPIKKENELCLKKVSNNLNELLKAPMYKKIKDLIIDNNYELNEEIKNEIRNLQKKDIDKRIFTFPLSDKDISLILKHLK